MLCAFSCVYVCVRVCVCTVYTCAWVCIWHYSVTMTSHTVLPSRLMTRNSHGCRGVSAYVNISLHSFALLLCAIRSNVSSETGGLARLCTRYRRIGACTFNKPFTEDTNAFHCLSQSSSAFTTEFQSVTATSVKKASPSKVFHARPVLYNAFDLARGTVIPTLTR